MNNPWDISPRSKHGDDDPNDIFRAVGFALTSWETLISELAELFDAMVSRETSMSPSSRAGFMAFAVIGTASIQAKLLTAAAPRALSDSPPLGDRSIELITRFEKLGARRNDIAHGRVYNLGEHGYYLCPNDVALGKWGKKPHNRGMASYQFTADNVYGYSAEFNKLIMEVRSLTAEVCSQIPQPTGI